MYTMKKKNPFFVLFLLLLVCSMSCRFHGHTRRVSVNNNGELLKIEYSGDISFNEDGTAIDAIAPFGYIKYKHNKKQVYIESDEDGTLRYKLYNEGRRIRFNDPEAGDILGSAVKEMEEHYYH